MKASLTNFKQSPRKVRLVADMIRGKNVLLAQDSLRFLPKKSAPELEKLLASAIANARTQGQNPENLFVSKIMVDKGSVIRRFKPMARGRAAGIRRTMSHIVLELASIAPKVESPKKSTRKSSKAKSTTSKAAGSKPKATS